ncbi:DUF1707 SHOCT-like domain-containing protein [Williamsia sp. Leaf354]|jgi:hypothetical protein|uniref:DUF1707 SHOCT-like domain-containing protein n=1 Tax=Williamsia sp. Leaf354 TaxID=1736349 RepID=UPI0006F33CAB|nr:DUF1707 domain-containing protein [Williamsia sp. Leaf354]
MMTTGPDDRTRARDVDRVSHLAILDDALADGQIDFIEYRRRVALAESATTLGELAALAADLQRVDRVPDAAVTQSWWRRRRVLIGSGVVAVVAAVVVGVVVVVPGDDSPSPAAAIAADPMLAGGMFTADGIRGVVKATRDRFHTTTVEGIHLYGSRAVLNVFDPASPNGSTQYDYSPGGEFYSPDFYGGLAVSNSSAPVDLARIDVDKVVSLIASAPARLRLTPANSAREQFRVTVGGDDGGEIWMGVNDIGIDSHLVTHLDGTIKGVAVCGWGC